MKHFLALSMVGIFSSLVYGAGSEDLAMRVRVALALASSCPCDGVKLDCGCAGQGNCSCSDARVVAETTNPRDVKEWEWCGTESNIAHLYHYGSYCASYDYLAQRYSYPVALAANQRSSRSCAGGR